MKILVMHNRCQHLTKENVKDYFGKNKDVVNIVSGFIASNSEE